MIEQRGDATDLLDLSEALLTPGIAGQPRDCSGQCFGRYRLVRLLGQGGMGQVYLAEQSAPVERRVAIKLASGTRLEPAARGLFELERQALARMSHPGIAQLFDAGTTADGTPFFAMEYVDGATLDAFVAAQSPSLLTRLELFDGICRAVEHAHRRGLLHCDLKPANVLVSELDQHWQPRLIDFGVARSLERADGSERVGTPAYMSPEQATAGAVLDTRSDVFALGVMLYELVASLRFRDSTTFKGQSADQVRAQVRDMAAPVWPARPVEMQRISRQRRFEFGCIVARATQRDPEQRYGSAAELADDLLRWRERRAVLAMANSGWYRARCVLRRHRLAFALGAAVLVSLGAGLLMTQQALGVAERQRDLATARQAELEKSVAFQRDLLTRFDLRRFSARLVALLAEKQDRHDVELGQATSGEALAEQLLALAPIDAVRDLLGEQWLDPAAELLEGHDSAYNAQMRLLLAQINRRFSRLDQAAALVDQAQAEFDKSGDADAVLAARFESARVVQDRGESSSAYRALENVVADIRQRLPEDAALRLQAEESWGTALVNQGRYAEALQAFAVPIRIGLQQERDDSPFRGLQSLEQRTQLYAAGLCDDALLRQMRTKRDAWRELADPSARAGSHYNLGSCHFWRGEYRAALPEFTQAVEQFRQFGGDYHPRLASQRSMQHLAALGAGVLDGLEAPLTQAVSDAERAGGVDSVAALMARQALYDLWSRQGRHADALPAYATLVETARRSAEANPALINSWLASQGYAQQRAGELVAAQQTLDAALALCIKLQGSEHADCLGLEIDVLRLRRLLATQSPQSMADSAAALCVRVDAKTQPEALLRSRCTALWLDGLDTLDGDESIAALREQRLGWMDESQLATYADEDQAVLRRWVDRAAVAQ
ncbi:MAG TPA: serine/threonine-protein kinase [Pseudomonadota bacterium]|nr:serine/threonine protein kinase [Xanthomonadales bacterium]HQW81249.1 serine/threonine-protein kinase [Pseudomonadota bacterium]